MAGDGGQGQDKTAGSIKELTSSTDQLLKALGDQNTAAIDLIGGVAGLIATATAAGATTLGIGAAVVGVVATLITLLDPSSGQSQAQLQQIAKQLAQLVQAESQEADNTRRTNIQNAISGAETIAGSLQDNANHLPLPTSEVTRQMQEILQSMKQLEPPDISGLGCQSAGNLGAPWEVPFNYQKKWTDADSPDVLIVESGPLGPFPGVPRGYGEQDPPKDPSGQVFNYTYVLPAYLYAVSTFVSTGLLIDPTFQQDFSNDVATAVCLLQSVHDFVLNKGISKLSPPPLTLQNLEDWSGVARLGVVNVTPTPPLGLFPEATPPPDPLGEPAIGIEYGAVELFSGYSSTGIYILGPPSTFDQNANYDAAFQIRLERRAKDVYRGAGLKKLQKTIDNLSKLIGKPSPAQGRQPFGDWSFRHDFANRLLPNLIRSDKTLHLRDVQTFLNNTPVKPTQQLIPSFHHVLGL